MIAVHFVKKERFRCLTCGREFARPDKLEKGHKCVAEGGQAEGGATASTTTVVQEGGVVGKDAVAGPSVPDSEIHDSRPSKRSRTARKCCNKTNLISSLFCFDEPFSTCLLVLCIAEICCIYS